MATTDTTTAGTSSNWLTNLSNGQMPTFPVNLSVDSSTLISLSAIAIIIVSIILFFKYKK